MCWGRENREAPVRLCGTSSQGWHFEVKALDGTANPYLATAALLYAGILGVRKGLGLRLGDLQGIAQHIGEAERAKLGITQRLARDLGQAIDALRKDEELVSGFSKELVAKYISTIEASRTFLQWRIPLILPVTLDAPQVCGEIQRGGAAGMDGPFLLIPAPTSGRRR